MERVAALLHQEGIHLLPAYLEGTSLRIGNQFELYPYQIIYREEGDMFIICSLTRLPDTKPQPQRFFQLWQMLWRIFQHCRPGFQELRMLILNEGDRGQKLQRIMRKKGAVDIYWDHNNWLSVSATALLRQRVRR